MSISPLFTVGVLGFLMLGQADDDDAPTADGPPRFITIKPVRVKETIVAKGVVQAGRSEDLVYRGSGETAIESLVPEGGQVKPGDVVCRLDASELKDQLMNQTLIVKSAEATYTTAKLTREVAEIAVTEYQFGTLVMEKGVLEGEQKLHLAAIPRDHKRLDRLISAQKQAHEALEQGLLKPSPSEILAEITIESHVEMAELRLRQDQDLLETDALKKQMLEKYTGPKRINELRAEVEKARSDELAKRATWERERAMERAISRKIDACRLVASIEGTVHYTNVSGPRAIEKGARVQTGQTIARLVDIGKTPVQLQATVFFLNDGSIEPGQSAWTRMPGQGETRFPGKVKSVTKVSVPTEAGRVPRIGIAEVVVDLEKAPPGIRVGMSLDVSITTAHDEVIAAPVKAVNFAVIHGESAVYKVAVKKPDGSLEWRRVDIGRLGQDLIEIKKGLGIGETVLANPLGQTASALTQQRTLELDGPAKPAQERTGR